jgi:hypothetical protein
MHENSFQKINVKIKIHERKRYQKIMCKMNYLNEMRLSGSRGMFVERRIKWTRKYVHNPFAVVFKIEV